MADANDDVKSEVTPEEFEGKETPKTDPSPVKEEKSEKPEGKDTKTEKETPAPPDVPPKEAEPEKEAEDKESDEADKPAEDADKPEDKPSETPKADERKQQLNTEIRDLVSQRNAIRAEVEKANEAYKPATEDELTDEVNPDTGEKYSSVEAKIEAMRQQQEIEKYNSDVADAQLTLHSEAERVLKEFPIFNPESDQYDKELATEAAALLEQNLNYDENTEQVIGSNVSPYQLYKTFAKARDISSVKGQIKGQQATERQLANADNASSAAPPSKAKDPLAELWSGEL